jgi:hypothetical protein
MYQITRAHIAQYGYVDSFFPRMTIDFCDKITGEAIDTVINGPNGTGKTSLLGALFSVFDPNLKRFLPAIANRSRHLSQYLDKSGVPALFAIENRTLGNVNRKIFITGQFLALRSDGGGEELQRLFFSFYDEGQSSLFGPGLTFDDLPGVRSREDQLPTFEAVQRWLKDAKQRVTSGNFFCDSSQDKWTAHLQAEGIDVKSYRTQLKFSEIEGGIDKAFLGFTSQSEFLKTMLSMTLSEDATQSTLDNVISNVARMKERPRQEAALAALTELAELFANFGGHATTYKASEATHGGNSLVLRQAISALLTFTEDQRGIVNAADEKLAAAIESVSGAKGAVQDLGSRTEALEASAHALAVLEVGEEVVQASTAQEGLALELLLLEAAKQQADLNATAAHITDIRSKIQKATAGLLAPEQAAMEAGVRYVAGITRDVGALRADISAVTSKIGACNDRKTALGSETTTLRQRLALQRDEASHLQSALTSLLKDQTALVIEGILIAHDETTAVAIARLDSTQREIDTRLAETLSRKTALEAALTLARSDLDKARSKAQSSLELSRQTSSFLTDLEKRTHHLRELPILARFGDSQSIDVLNSAFVADLNHRVDALTQGRARLSAQKEQLDADIQTVSSSELAQVNPDAQRVVAHLQACGVKSAKTQFTYLAHVLQDAQKARSLVSSDPGRFAGVHVDTLEDLNRTKAVSFATTGLFNPVIVSLGTLTATGEPDENRLVIAPTNAAGFNREAATEELARMQADSEALALKISEAGEELISLRLLRESQQQIVTLLNGRTIPEAVTAARDALRLAALTAAAEQEAKVSVSTLDKQISDIANLPMTLAVEQQRISTHRRRLLSFAAQADSTRNHRIRLTELAALTSNIDERLAHNATQVQSEDAERDNLLAWQGDVRARIEPLESRLTKHSPFYAVTEEVLLAVITEAISLEALEQVFTSAKRHLDTLAKDQVGELQADLRNEETRYDERTTIFGKLYKGLSAADIRARLIRNHDQEISRLELDAPRLKKQLEAALNKNGAVIHSATIHAKGREFPEIVALECPASAKLAFDAVAALTLELKAAKDRATDADILLADVKVWILQAKQTLDLLTQEAKRHKKMVALGLEGLPTPTAAQLAQRHEIINVVTEAAQSASDSEAALRTARDGRQTAYDLYSRALDKPSVGGHLPQALADGLRSNEIEAVADDAAAQLERFHTRIEVLRHSIGETQQYFDQVTHELVGVVEQVRTVLISAAHKKLPSSLPVFGGYPVLKMEPGINAVTEDVRHQRVEAYLQDLLVRPSMPATYADLATEAVLRVLNGASLRIRIIKASQHDTVGYDPVDKIPGSGGERALAAVLLWTVVSRVRKDYGDVKSGALGTLIIDNPFSTVNHEPLLRMMRETAKASRLQLIFTTGEGLASVAAVFDHPVFLVSASARHKVSGRKYVEVGADPQFLKLAQLAKQKAANPGADSPIDSAA